MAKHYTVSERGCTSGCAVCAGPDAVALYRCADCYALRAEERAPCWSCGIDEIVDVEFYCEEHGHGLLDGHFCFEWGCRETSEVQHSG